MLGVSYIELVIVPVSHNEFLSELYDFHDGESGLAGDLETRTYKRTTYKLECRVLLCSRGNLLLVVILVVHWRLQVAWLATNCRSFSIP